jgi:ABC-type protease/lipase transport system fused ATPase/permease subunit
VSFDLAPGEFLGIVGPSGAGKTTLCRLLLGIWPAVGGKVFLDGQDVFTLDRQRSGHCIGYLPQEVEMFDATVGENIARFSSPDPDAVSDVLDLARCRDLVEHLPKGLDTPLGGEGGFQLSGGQKQKIGLARALYRGPAFVVLDEPSANFDDTADAQLMDTLEDLKQGGACTCVVVTHKRSLLQAMDKLLVLKQGRMALFGPRDAVLAHLAGGKAS